MGGGADLTGGWGLQPNLLSFGSKGVGRVTAESFEFRLYGKVGGGSWGGWAWGGRGVGGRRGGWAGGGGGGGVGTTRQPLGIQTPHFHTKLV